MEDDVSMTAAPVGPQRYTCTYALTEESATRSRHDIALALGAWGLNDLVDSASLVVTELVTNSVRHCTGSPGRTGKVTVIIRRTSLMCVLIEVKDSDPTLPVKKEAPPEEIGGRGLVLVEALASRWGFEPVRCGKKVWAEIQA